MPSGSGRGRLAAGYSKRDECLPVTSVEFVGNLGGRYSYGVAMNIKVQALRKLNLPCRSRAVAMALADRSNASAIPGDIDRERGSHPDLDVGWALSHFLSPRCG